MYDKWFGKDPIFTMDVGYTFKYKKTFWEVLEVYEYTWGEGKSREYKVLGNGQEAFLEIEEDDDDINCLFSYEIKKDQISPEISAADLSGQEVLAELDFLGERYMLDEIAEGTYHNLTTSEGREHFANFAFYRKNNFINIVLWEDGSLEFADGKEIRRKKIKNIEPPSSGHASDNNLFS